MVDDTTYRLLNGAVGCVNFLTLIVGFVVLKVGASLCRLDPLYVNYHKHGCDWPFDTISVLVCYI